MLWKKRALGNRADLFKIERKDISAKKEQREIGELKSQIAHKDSVIAWKNKSGVAIVVDTIAYKFLEAKKLYDKATSSDNLNLSKDFFESLSNELEK